MAKKGKKFNTIYYCILFFILILIFINIAICLQNNKELSKININSKNTINVVVARYKEDLKWTLEEPFNKFKYIVYNKGDNEKFEKTNVIEIIKLEDIGRDFHTHFYHIVNNYDNLADINVFLPGSIELYYKKKKAIHMLNKIIKYNQAVLSVPFIPYTNKLLYNYKHEVYINSTNNNIGEVKISNSDIRPFGKWYENFFENDLHYLTQYGIFSVNKNDIIQHPKSRYETFLSQLSRNKNPEEMFFIEISIYSIFYPYINTIVEINYSNFINTIPDLFDKFFKFFYKNYK
jgi:hypothetical protein